LQKEGELSLEEKTFTLRVSLEVHFPDAYDGDEDEYAWLREWETEMKGELVKAVFASLRRHPSWQVRVRNRGISERDEIEVVVAKHVS